MTEAKVEKKKELGTMIQEALIEYRRPMTANQILRFLKLPESRRGSLTARLSQLYKQKKIFRYKYRGRFHYHVEPHVLEQRSDQQDLDFESLPVSRSTEDNILILIEDNRELRVRVSEQEKSILRLQDDIRASEKLLEEAQTKITDLENKIALSETEEKLKDYVKANVEEPSIHYMDKKDPETDMSGTFPVSDSNILNRDIAQLLTKEGWRFVRRGTGSHLIFRHPERKQISIPNYRKFPGTQEAYITSLIKKGSMTR